MKLRHFAVVLPLTATILGGCGPEDMQDEQSGSAGQPMPTQGMSPNETEPTLGTATQELASLGAHTWSAPADATPMGATADRFCFLNRIRGNFVSAGSYMDIFASGGSWYLRGGGDTRGTARCATRTSATGLSSEYVWKAGQRLPTNMGTTTGRVCFLVRVSGSFDSGADWVRVYASGGSWFLFGDSAKGDGGAQARCVNVSSFSGEYSWSSSQSYDTHMGVTSGRVCALTYMAGRFDSVNDYIDIYASSGSWYLGGNASAPAVSAKARCF
ncbi:hypothetical protein [Archangium lansingense]|uniref:Lipoprotein n=1 Tax=Archangium lansingense TaxID=2995310 RepID=A0ABT4A7N7_9BACT|nr:hypothetical protein [Archangium lansinium]MCY1077669.1 hypothetical protein [Archangium lansinium]